MKSNRRMENCKSELPPLSSSQNLPGLYTTKKLYKNPPVERCVPYGNLMYDRRVIRGSTVRRPLITTCPEPARCPPKTSSRYTLKVAPPTIAAIKGMVNQRVQTELYLEELFENPPESDVACQTDLFMDRRDSPRYMPFKTGLDASTQIYPGELFDFDLEVQSIVEVIVGKTLEQSLVEVFEDDELAALHMSRRRFEERRDAEEAEKLRLEEEERRLEDEKQRRVEQFETACRLQREVEERVAAAVLTHGYLHDFLPDVLTGLRSAGFLLDNIRSDMEKEAVPEIWEDVRQNVWTNMQGRDILTDMVRDINEARALVYAVLGDQEDEIPKLRRTCHLLHDSSDDEDVVFDDDGDYWEIVNRGDEERRRDDGHGGYGTAPVTPTLSQVEAKMKVLMEVEEEEEGRGGVSKMDDVFM